MKSNETITNERNALLTARLTEANALVAEIADWLRDTEANAAQSDWGTVGDLGRVNALLGEIAEALPRRALDCE